MVKQIVFETDNTICSPASYVRLPPAANIYSRVLTTMAIKAPGITNILFDHLIILRVLAFPSSGLKNRDGMNERISFFSKEYDEY